MNKKLGKIVLFSIIVILLAVGVFSVFKVYTISKKERLMEEEITSAADLTEETVVDEETVEKETVDEESAGEETAGEESVKERQQNKEPVIVSDSDEYVQEELDTFYSMVSEVVEEIPVEDSTDVLSGKEAIELLNSRGFNGEYAKTTCFLNGDYSSNIVLTETTEEKYPIYELWESVYDEKGNGYLWFVAIADDDIMAAPIMDGDGWDFMVSESNIVTSYIQVTNMFYKNVPKRPLIQVDRIDYDTLVELSVQHAAEE